MSAKRVGVEILIVLVLALAGAGLWWGQDRRHASRLAQERSLCRVHVASLREQAERWADGLAAGEAAAAFRAFAAGVQPAVLSGRRESVEQAVTALLELPGIDAVHVLGADGAVLAGSDRKLLTTGRVDERGAWVLATTALTTRAGDRPGVVELAAPVVGAAGPAGFLWIGYRTGRVRDAARPEGWREGAESGDSAAL
jgi:hypothetical protein